MTELIIAGAGTGNFAHMTPEVREAILRADVVCGSGRFRKLVPPSQKFIPLTSFAETFTKLEHESGQVVILVSGDPGVYSLLPIVRKRFPSTKITVLPGISSLQVLCAYAGESWSDAVILSGHGRSLSVGRFLNVVERNRLVILFCDGVNSPQRACEKLAGLSVVSAVIGENLGTTSRISVAIGENLGSESQRILSGTPQDFVTHESPELSLMLVKNHRPFSPENLHPRDREFLRAEGVVMTNESVRAVILARLNLRSDSVLWDIGAGTGSISVCAGLEFPESEIHAVECKPEAVRVIAQNAGRFHLHNIAIHEARALDVMETLPKPTHVFIGGSNGELAGILARVGKMGEGVRVVVACVTLETFGMAYTLMKTWPEFEAVQVSITESKPLTDSSTLMKPKCPIMLLSAMSEQNFSPPEKFTP
ncbi:MAG: precorrin-6y C5,15-methyltransferase (decarboxylating) subunit CbiE [Synergistaceae bacterium]|nr:precorrin-6y C5,15-methyltransferase (decarboxylating) subunit CbiE [Synergistaceae bacterium]